MNDITIQIMASEADRAAAIQLKHVDDCEVMALKGDPHFSRFHDPAVRFDRINKPYNIKLSRTVWWLAYKGAVPIGYSWVWERPPTLECFGVFVIKGERQHGYGRQLLETQIEYGKSRGFRAMETQIRANNPGGIALAKKLSFTLFDHNDTYTAYLPLNECGQRQLELLLREERLRMR